MTDKERIIVSAYTGVLMCEFSKLHEYIEKILGRPVFTHEMANENVWKEIKEKFKEDFMKLCSENNTDIKTNFDRIKAMSVEELVEEITLNIPDECDTRFIFGSWKDKKQLKEWLEAEVAE